MYGTIFHMKVIDGETDEFLTVFRAWEEDRRPKVKGIVAGYLLKKDADANEYIGVAVFESKELYIANGNDPEQGEWFGKLRAHLQADPVWEDGEYVITG